MGKVLFEKIMWKKILNVIYMYVWKYMLKETLIKHIYYGVLLINSTFLYCWYFFVNFNLGSLDSQSAGQKSESTEDA